MSTPLVSVIIPVYNGARYLSQAITSVMRQDYRQIEVIVVDDGSSDGSGNIAQSFGSKVRYHYQQNRGLSAAQNKGVELAEGEFVSFLDSDDLWVPEKTRLQVHIFQAHSELDIVFGYVQHFHDLDLSDELKAQRRITNELMPGFSTGTLLVKRTSFHRVGLFSINIRVGEFIDWYAKAIDKGLKYLMLPEVLLKRRIHDDNMGVRDRDKRTDYLHVLKASLDRRRRKNGVCE